MKVKNLENRVIVFPDEGTLFVCSDLHGNLADYMKMVSVFYKEKDAYLLFLGDLIHGPVSEEQLKGGIDYLDASEDLLDHFFQLQEHNPGRVFSLLGNHEHAHIGGPMIAKFTMNEAATLGVKQGKEKEYHCRKRFAEFPLLAMTRSIAFTHGAPSLHVTCLDDLLSVDYQSYEKKKTEDILLTTLDLLWRRQTDTGNTDDFLRAIAGENQPNFVVYGHKPAPGYQKFANSMILSTSFMTHRFDKTYLKIDLSKDYDSLLDLEKGRELLKLYSAKIDTSAYAAAREAVASGDYASAVEALVKVETNSYGSYLLGLAYFMTGELEKAAALTYSSLIDNPCNPRASFLLGNIYEDVARGDMTDKMAAVYAFKSALNFYRQTAELDNRLEQPVEEAKQRLFKLMEKI